MKTTPIAAALASLVVALGATLGCQTYDFEPVQPLAVAQTTQSYTTIGSVSRPNMMLVVDKSGSMDTAIPGGGGATRMTEMRSAMSTFLQNNGTVARMGLVLFPQGSGCPLTTNTAEDIPTTDDIPTLTSKANAIRAVINATVASGGTPTQNAIAYAAQNPILADPARDNFILLLTDGLPNCNLTPLNGNTCRCTAASQSTCQSSPTQCLDDVAVVDTITSIRANPGIRTIVVGFGADTAAGLGPETLQAMALAGGFPSSCPGGTNAECGNGTCDTTTKLCSTAFYQAANATELANILATIAGNVNQLPCDYALAVFPTNKAFVSVLINGVVTPAGPTTWRLLDPGDPACGTACPQGEIQLLGAQCTAATAADKTNPLHVEVRLLQAF